MMSRMSIAVGCTAVAVALAGCGGDDEPAADEPPVTAASPAEEPAATSPDSSPATTTAAVATTAAPDAGASGPAPAGASFLRVTIGPDTFEYTLGDSPGETCAVRNFGGMLVLSAAFNSGASATIEQTPDGFDESSKIEVVPDKENDRYVSWIANSGFSLPGFEPGQSGIETLTIDENGASGTATFVRDDDGSPGDIMPGTFEIVCVDS